MSDLWIKFRDAFLTPARVVPLITVAVGSAVSYVVALAAQHGLNLDQGEVLAFALPIILGAVATALNWQVGRQKWEKQINEQVLAASQYPEYAVKSYDEADDPFETNGEAWDTD